MNHIWCTRRFYYVQYLLSAPGPLEIDLRAESFDSVTSGIKCLSLTLPLIIDFINFWPASDCCKSLRKYSVFFPPLRRHGMTCGDMPHAEVFSEKCETQSFGHS